MQSFRAIGQLLHGEKYVTQKKERGKKQKKNNPQNSGHFVLLQHQRAAQALCSDQFDNVRVRDINILRGNIPDLCFVNLNINA
jgi:hypothetical protein